MSARDGSNAPGPKTVTAKLAWASDDDVADVLVTSARVVAALRADLAAAVARAETAERERDAARAALRPFAEVTTSIVNAHAALTDEHLSAARRVFGTK